MGKLGPRGGWGEAGHWVQPRGCGKTRGIRTCSVSCRRIAKMGGGLLYLCKYFPSPEAPCQKVEKKDFSLAQKVLRGAATLMTRLTNR